MFTHWENPEHYTYRKTAYGDKEAGLQDIITSGLVGEYNSDAGKHKLATLKTPYLFLYECWPFVFKNNEWVELEQQKAIERMSYFSGSMIIQTRPSEDGLLDVYHGDWLYIQSHGYPLQELIKDSNPQRSIYPYQLVKYKLK